MFRSPRLALVIVLAVFSLPLLARAEPPPIDHASLERPLPTSAEVGIPDVVLLAGEAIPPAPTAGQSFLASLGPSLLDLLSAAAIGGIGLLAAFLRAKAAESKVAKVSLVVTEAARAAVLELDAAVKPKLKAFLADGKLSDEEKAELKRLALDMLKTKLPGGLLSTAGAVFGAFTDTYLAGKIEQAVAEKNSVQAAAVPPSP